jgi:tetratricopeptide (TPR) repeat protein
MIDVWAAMEHLRAARFAPLDAHFNALQANYERGEIDDLKLADQFSISAIRRVDLIPAVEAWAAAFPQSYAARHSAVSLHVRAAWEGRGEASAQATSSRQFKQMQHHFDAASKHLDIAMTITPRPVLTLIQWLWMRMAAGLEDDAPDYMPMVENLLPQSALLCINMFQELHPKWGGDEDALDTFIERVRKWTWTDQQRRALESNYFTTRADIASCEGSASKAMQWATTALDHARTFEALIKMAELHNQRAEPHAAIRLYNEALAQGPSARAYHFLGTAQEALGEKETATEAFEKALKLGYGESASSLVWLHHQAGPDPVMHARVASWFAQGIAQYSNGCMGGLGNFIFSNYCGYSQDMAQVAHWWHLAGEWGNCQSLRNLALDYWDGRAGFPKDYKKAFAAANAAAQLGCPDIADTIGRMHYLGHGTTVNYEAALPYLAEAAQEGNARSIACLIRALWFGHGTHEDREAAKSWLERLAEADKDEYKTVKSEISGVSSWIRTGLSKLRK